MVMRTGRVEGEDVRIQLESEFISDTYGTEVAET